MDQRRAARPRHVPYRVLRHFDGGGVVAVLIVDRDAGGLELASAPEVATSLGIVWEQEVDRNSG